MADGYQAVSLALRAPRVAVLFATDGDWASWAAHALARMCQYWGGAGFILVPYGANGVSESMLATTAAYDPDYVVLTERSIGEAEAVGPAELDLTAEDGTTFSGEERRLKIAQLADNNLPSLSGFNARSQVVQYCNSYRQYFGPPGSSKDDIDEPIQSFPRDVIDTSPLTHMSKVSNEPAAFGLNQDTNFDPLWTLAVAAKVGFHDAPNLPLRFDDTSPDERAIYRYALDVDALDAVPPDSLRVFPGTDSAWDRTTRGLVWTSRPTHRSRHLVVVGRTAEDYCHAFAWDRMYGAATWLPFEETPKQGEPGSSAVWSLGHQLKTNAMYRRAEAMFVSWSLDNDRLETVRNEVVGDEVVFEGEEETDFAPRPGRVDELVRVVQADRLDWPVGLTLSITDSYDHALTLPASFDDDGSVHLLDDLPRLEPSTTTLSHIRNWETDVRLEQRTFPYGRQFPSTALVRRDPGDIPDTWIRSGRDSFSVNSQSHGMIYATATRRQSMPRTRISQPGFRGWVAAKADADGVRTEFSDAGRRVEVLRRLWGNRAELVSDWSTMRKVIRAFRSDKRLTSEAFPDDEGFLLRGTGDAYLTFAGMSNAWEIGPEESKQHQLRDWTDKLISRRVLRRGVILGCKECAHLEFVALSVLGDSNACSRCGAANQMTQERWSKSRSEAEPKWFYDLHQAARSLIGDDGGVSLLAADYFARVNGKFESVAEMDFFDQESGERLAEIDLIAYAGDRLIVAEAKTVPKLGTKKERSKKIIALTRTAKLLHADEILLCSARQEQWTPADLDALKQHLTYEFPVPWRRPRACVLTGLDHAEPTYQQL